MTAKATHARGHLGISLHLLLSVACAHDDVDVRLPAATVDESLAHSKAEPAASPAKLVQARPAGPQVKLGSPTLAGVTGKDVVTTVVRYYQAQLRECYATSLLKAPSLSGQLTVTFVIDRSGAVAHSTTKGELDDGPLLHCITMAFRRMEFPPPEERNIKVEFPLTFIAPEHATEVQSRP